MNFIIVNGEIIKKEETNLTSLFWNDPLWLTDKVWFGFGGIPLLSQKTEKLISQLQHFGAEAPPLFYDQRELFRRIKRMLNKNRFYLSGLITIQILISENDPGFIISATPFELTEFPYREKGVLIRLANVHKYSKTPVHLRDIQARYIERLADRENTDAQIQKSVFLNDKGVVCDAGTTNIFLVKKNDLYTPSLDTGSIDGSLRPLVIEASKNTGLNIIESAEIIPREIYKMDEIFFAGEASGIEWVLGIATKRFVHTVSGKIHEKLNEILKKKAL